MKLLYYETDFLIYYKFHACYKTRLKTCFIPRCCCNNNAIESFNNVVKRNYTFGVRHSLPALFNLIVERILVDVSLDVELQRKCYEVWCKPDISVCRSARAITVDCYKIEQINHGKLLDDERVCLHKKNVYWHTMYSVTLDPVYKTVYWIQFFSTVICTSCEPACYWYALLLKSWSTRKKLDPVYKFVYWIVKSLNTKNDSYKMD